MQHNMQWFNIQLKTFCVWMHKGSHHANKISYIASRHKILLYSLLLVNPHLPHLSSPHFKFLSKITSIYFFVAVLGFELGTSHLLGRLSTTWPPPPVLFHSGYFEDRVLIFAQVSWIEILFYTSQSLQWQAPATMPSTFPLRWGPSNFFFAQAVLEPWSSQSQPPT
jgi:hypothetical protein